MGKLTVRLPDAQYDVHIGEHVYELFSSDYKSLLHSADRVGIIADEQAADTHQTTRSVRAPFDLVGRQSLKQPFLQTFPRELLSFLLLSFLPNNQWFKDLRKRPCQREERPKKKAGNKKRNVYILLR